MYSSADPADIVAAIWTETSTGEVPHERATTGGRPGSRVLCRATPIGWSDDMVSGRGFEIMESGICLLIRILALSMGTRTDLS
jgi:hypothetical protein